MTFLMIAQVKMRLVYIVLHLFLVVTLITFNADGIDVDVTCADQMTLYADGQTIGTHSDKTTSKRFAIHANTKIVGIKCIANSQSSVSGGILASFNVEYTGDYITDASWRCSNKYNDSWSTIDFDDKYWMYANDLGTNTNSASDKPTGISYVNGISTYADWIWTSNHLTQNGDLVVYCRGQIGLQPTKDSQGRKFVLGFMENYSSPKTDLKILFTTSKPTYLTIRITTPLIPSSDVKHIDETIKITAGEIKVVKLHYSLRNKVDHVIEQKSVLVVATSTIKIMAENHEKYSTDMYLAIPTTSLGSETDNNVYFAVSWNAAQTSRLLVVLLYDNTQVKITVTDSITYSWKTYKKGQTINILFHKKYESLQLALNTVTGFTGTKISSNKPIVAYSGNQRAIVDNGVYSSTRDHLVEQLTPVITWGKEFILTPLPYGPVDNGKTRSASQLSHYVILAAEDGTTLSITGYVEDSNTQSVSLSKTINEGEFYQYTHKRGTVAIVTANKGIMVGQVATSKRSNEHCLGDPWLQLIPPSYQYAMDYLILTPVMSEKTGCYKPIHYCTIIIRPEVKDGLLRNNKLIVTPFHSIPNSPFVYQTIELEYGLHRIQHQQSSVSFGLYFFGYGSMDSYASMGGTRMAPINVPCVSSSSKLGDGVDNDCDGQIDEDTCAAHDPSKDCASPNPVNGGWSNWTTSGTCTCVNGVGKQKQIRICNNPLPMYDGWPCDTSAVGTTREVSCSCVPVDGQWSTWQSWSDCSVSCDQGSKTRSRSCTNPYPANGGADCIGNRTEEVTCTKILCPIHGGWSNWTQFGICACALGETNGKEIYNRTCTNPTPQHGGKYCDVSVHGDSKEVNCNCPPVLCDKLPQIANGYYDHPNCSTTGRVYRDVCKGQCDTGYYNTADEVFTCTKYGTWSSNNYTQCQIYHCPAVSSVTSNIKCPGCNILPKVLNPNYDKAECTSGGVDYNNSCTASCDKGYNLAGVQNLWCNELGKWNPANFPRCGISSCNALPVPGNGSYSPINCQTNGVDYPQYCTLTCNPSYLPVGDNLQHCTSTGKWTYEINGTLPYCKSASCSILPKDGINSTLFIPPGILLFGMYVTYTCIEGHHFASGDVNRYCQLTEDWSGYPLVCKPVQCPVPSLPQFTDIIGGNQTTEYAYKDVINYQCQVGYEWLGGDLIRTCQSEGSFSGFEPVCRKKLCHSLPVVPNARIYVGSGDTVNAVMYECLEGYQHISGDLVRHCLLSKTWNGTSPTCSEIKCLTSPSLTNTYFNMEDRVYKSKSWYNCIKGYEKIGGDDYLVCNISGEWEGNHLTCQEKSCGQVPSLLLNKTFGYNVYDKSLHTCYEGYYHGKGIATAMCLETKKWEQISPVCEEINCGVPPTLYNAQFSTGGSTSYNSIVDYQCNAGYTNSLSKVSTTCKSEGWAGTNINCISKLCELKNITGVEIQYNSGVEHNDVLISTCVNGYTLISGDTERICLNGQWSGMDLNCQRTECAKIESYDDIVFSASGYYVQDTLTYDCKANTQYSSGDKTRYCTNSGSWSGSATVCREIVCKELWIQWPIVIHYEGLTVGSYAFISCGKGYNVQDRSNDDEEYSIRCDSNGNWTGDIPVCQAITCGTPPNVLNATLVYNGTNYLDQVKIVPDEGYYLLEGDEYLLCGEDRNWIGDVPKTVAKECPIPNLPRFGLANVTSLTVGAVVQFECEENYTLTGDVIIVCLPNTTWDAEVPSCIKNIPQKPVPTPASIKLDLKNVTKDPSEIYTPTDHIMTHVLIGIIFLSVDLFVLFIFCIIDASNLKRDLHYLKENLFGEDEDS